jgi:hypothetical protein
MSNPEVQVVQKYCFHHPVLGKKYVVGAFTREDAVEMVANICGDTNFCEVDLPPEHQ